MLQPFHTAVGRLRVTCITTAKRDKITVVPLTKYASVKNQIQIHVDNTTEPMAEVGCAETCSVCGGTGCSKGGNKARDCCSTRITLGGKVCGNDTQQAPCTILELIED